MNEQNGWYRPRHPRIDRVTLITPFLKRPGELIIRLHALTAAIQWASHLDDHPASQAFAKLLESEGWHIELIRRLNSAGYQWDLSPRIHMPHQTLRRIPHHEIAEFIRDTLPGVFLRATARFAEQHAHLKPEPSRMAKPVTSKKLANRHINLDTKSSTAQVSAVAQNKDPKWRKFLEAGSD